MKRLISILVLSLMIPSLVLGAQIPTEPTQAAETTVVLPAFAPIKEQPVLMAHITDADREAMRVTEEAKKPRASHSWDTFVDVHFGGYRWAWWALAGGVLIAIHAGK